MQNDLGTILEVAKIYFRENVDQNKILLRSIPVDIISDSTLGFSNSEIIVEGYCVFM